MLCHTFSHVHFPTESCRNFFSFCGCLFAGMARVHRGETFNSTHFTLLTSFSFPKKAKAKGNFLRIIPYVSVCICGKERKSPPSSARVSDGTEGLITAHYIHSRCLCSRRFAFLLSLFLLEHSKTKIFFFSRIFLLVAFCKHSRSEAKKTCF